VPQYVVRYRKAEAMRWISHLDLKRTLEYAMRRARLPLELTQGHNPHPKLSFGPPLSLGVTGEAELLAVHLTEAWTPERLREQLGAQLPPGLELAEAWVVPGYKKKETFGELDLAEYRAVVEEAPPVEELQRRIREVLDREEVIVERGGNVPSAP
jgi:radical SAM-linked protein